MKKTISILLCLMTVLTSLTLAGCANKEEPLKFGLGIYTDITKATNAEGDTNGQGKASITAAAITVDNAGKLVACDLDTADITVAYTAEGKAIANDGFQTKGELGDSYNMKAYGGATKEWYEQANTFEELVIGKTLDEIKALVAEGDKGTAEVINAGCTITIHEFVRAIEKAFDNAAASAATASSSVTLGTHTEQSTKDAEGDKNGQNQIETTFFAAATDTDGRIVAAYSDCVQISFTFTANGSSTYDLTKTVSGKRESGANYGMSQWGTDGNGDGVIKEWFEQAAAFDAACIGKTAGEISTLLGENGYGNADLQTAGCTILVNGLIKAASKIG